MSTEDGEVTAASWKWYSVLDEAIGGRPSITPPNLIASSRPDVAILSEVNSSKSREEEEGHRGTDPRDGGGGSRKRNGSNRKGGEEMERDDGKGGKKRKREMRARGETRTRGQGKRRKKRPRETGRQRREKRDFFSF